MPQEGARLSIQGEQWKVIEVNAVLGQLKLASEDGRVMNIEASRFEKIDNRWTISRP
jgi:hypothetical protein